MPRAVKFYHSIVFKILAQIAFVIIVLSSIFLITNYNTLYSKLLREYENDLAYLIRNDVGNINSEITHLQDDVLFLSKLDGVTALLTHYENQHGVFTKQLLAEQEKLSKVFHSLIENRSNYFQIRLISYYGKGREVVRVDKELSSGRVIITPTAELQEKGNRDYVKESKKYPFSYVYLSDIQLNREHGIISEPRTATIRGIVKIKSRDNRPIGVAVINYSIDKLFSQLNKDPLDATNVFLWNQNGEFLIHPDSSKTFAFEYGDSSNVNKAYPAIVNTYKRELATVNETLASGMTNKLHHVGDYLFAANSILLNHDKRYDSRPLTLAHIGNYSEIVAPARAELIHMVMILALTVPFVITGSILLSRRITKPIEILNHAVVRYDYDNTQDFKERTKLALQSTGEAGVLARSFLKLQENIQKINNYVKNNEAKLRSLLDNMGDAVISINESGIIIFVNQHAETMFGYEQDELVGKNISVLMTDNEAKAHDSHIKAYIRSGRSEILGMQRELAAKTKSGRVFYIELVVSESKLNNEVSLTAVIRDVTQRKKEEQLLRIYASELKRSNEELDKFAYVASHDLKAPLRNIWQVISWIEEDKANTEELHTNLRLIKERATKMQHLLDDLLEYSRIGRRNAAIEQFEAAKVIQDQFNLLNNDERVQLYLLGDFPILVHNRTMFEQMFRNLIDNAIKYNDKEKGHISISCKDISGFYEFSVKDDGSGIDPEYIDKIFDFLQRVNLQIEGSGMGLSLVKKILDNIGGSIRVESSVGEGTTFYISWPKRAVS